MGVRKDLKKAKQHPGLADRVKVELVRENGVVREARTTPLTAPPTTGSVADIPFTNAAEAPDAIVLRRKVSENWIPVTAAEFATEVTTVAKGLVAAGLAPDERVAVMSRTRYEWELLDFAIWAAGGQSVPVYPTSSADQVHWILTDSHTRFVIAETAGNVTVVNEAASNIEPTERPRIWQLDHDAVAELQAMGSEVTDEEIAQRRSALSPESIATICYTSGTTGRPKGCALTHQNLLSEADNTVGLLHPVFEAVSDRTASTLLFLPLAHVLGRTIQISCLRARIELGHCPSIKPDELRPELKSFRPSFVVGVPYLFEKIHDTGRATAERMGRGASFDRADRIAQRYGGAALAKLLGNGPGPGPKLQLAAWLYDLLVYRRVRKELGGRLRYAISGGSPLDRGLNLFFWACGIVIYEGYGLTETTAAATLVPPLEPRPGTVGQPVPGTAVRIADDGEVLIRGGVVFETYWNNQRATDEALTDGWFATGDLGELTEEGYLTITGRKKDILVTTGGKNVSPSMLEDRLRSRPPVGQCMVVGDNRSFVGAVITLDRESVEHWLAVRKRPRDTPTGDLRDDPELLADVQRAVDFANEAVSRPESIRRFVLVEGEFTEENGMLTPSLKVKRQAVARAYEREIESLYTP